MDESSLLLTSLDNAVKIISEETLYTTFDLYFKSQFASCVDYSTYSNLILLGFNNGSI